MKRYFLLIAIVAYLATSHVHGQEPAADDAIGKQAAALEAELGKYKDSTPEAAEAMVKLTNLYHADGRLFGLVQVAQQFVASHSSDPRHKAIMLKLIDGQEALSRNKELSVTIRQFLSRYPDAAECPTLEIRLAEALLQLEDRRRSAEACWTVWKRQGPNETGRRYGVQAAQSLSLVNAGDASELAAQYADAMLDQLPAGEFAREFGLLGVNEYRRVGQWAKSSVVGTKMLQKGLGGDTESQRQLHLLLAENHANLGQHANAAQSLRQARALRDDPLVHFQLIYRLYHAGAKPGELEPVVAEFGQKYPQRLERFQAASYLAHSCLANAEKPRGVSLLTALLAEDPIFNSNASAFVRENGIEPPQLADSEQKLLQAINQNKPGVYYLRYVLGLELYRDRLKDLPKAKQALRELIAKSPSNDSYTSGAIDWLLYNSADDAEFNNDLALVLVARKQNPHIAVIGEAVRLWAQNARANKDYAVRANVAGEELKKSNADPLIAAWIAQVGPQHAPGEAIRNQLLQPETFNQLNEGAARALLQMQADYYRHYASGDKRPQLVRIYTQYAAKFPQDAQVAWWWLESTTDYGTPAEMKTAATNYLRFPAEVPNGDTNRRLMVAADKNTDAVLARASLTWITQTQQKFGPDSTSASTIGDLLLKLMLENEAVQYWTMGMTANRQTAESRECAARLLARTKEPPARIAFIQELLKVDSDFHGRYAEWLADEYFKLADWGNFEAVLKAAYTRQLERPLRGWDADYAQAAQWIDLSRANMMLKDDAKQRILIAVRDFHLEPNSSVAHLLLTEAQPAGTVAPLQRLLDLERVTREVGNEWMGWDRLTPFAQSAVGKKDFAGAAVIATGMLSNIPNVDEARKKFARDLVTQSLSRMGGVGLSIDDSSPLAPLLQAAMYYRLGDERLALDTYRANKKLFDDNRNQLPPDFLVFVCDRLIATGDDADHDYVEEILRGWLVQFSESMQQDDVTKARMQLLLAKNFFKAQRFDVARAEYTTVVNRYGGTPQAIEAEFGIGETYLSQKVYDQAELVFEKLSRSSEIEVVVRAEFLRGVLAFRRGDRDEARDIFKAVLERVPNVELANQALFNLAEVYGAEERYIDQLNLLRTVGRLGRASKRRHVPGTPLSIVVHDSDLGISRGHNRIPVRVTTLPGGDVETVYLVGSGAGKGLFRADLETRLGQASAGDNVLQLTGKDVIRCDYPEEFKADFKNVPLSDVEIQVAADAKFQVSSSKIEDVKQETLSDQLAREHAEERADKRVSQTRPANQIKPGNPIYIRIKDGDRDLSGDIDNVVVKLTADSGDQIQVSLKETDPHSGVFEGMANTGDLPAGALASDTAIDHSPLMAIDRDLKTYWMSEPDGATPKWLSVDMKDLRKVSRTKLVSPDPTRRAPVRGELLGSQDGQFWFRLASNPEREPALPLGGEYAAMIQHLFPGDYTSYTTWDQIAALSKNVKPTESTAVETLLWKRPETSPEAAQAFAIFWQGKFIQPKEGAARIHVGGTRAAVLVDGILEMPVGAGGRSIDLWLTAGPHDLAIFAASNVGQQPVEAKLARASLTTEQVNLLPFRAADFDLTSAAAQKPAIDKPVNPTIPLLLKTGVLTKKTEQFGLQVVNNVDILTNWQLPDDVVRWDIEVPAPGPYEVWVEFAHEGDGGKYRVEIDNKPTDVRVANSGGWQAYRKQRVATVLLDTAGKHSIAIKPLEVVGASLINLKEAWLVQPAGGSVVAEPGSWEFRYPEQSLRFVRFACQEYLGDALAISNVEVSGADVAHPFIPTQEDVLSLAANNTLEIAGGDEVLATYTDEVTLSGSTGNQLLTGKLQATYFNAAITPIAYEFERSTNGQVTNVRTELKRIDPGERITVEIIDYDEDRSNERDTLGFEVIVNDGEPQKLEATETNPYTGIFTKEIDTSAKPETGKLTLKAGDRVTLRYSDTHNTFPGHAVPREDVVYVASPTAGVVRVLETRVIPGPDGKTIGGQVTVLPKRDQPVSGVAFEAPLTVEVIDADAAKDSRSSVLVSLATTDGATVDVLCQISPRFSDLMGTFGERQALEEGRFLGQVVMQLGGRSSPALVPLTTDMPRDLVGKVRLGEKTTGDNATANLVTRVLNLSGKDVVTATYADEIRPAGKPAKIIAKGRLISNGQLKVTDRDYDKPITQLHVGERVYISVIDADLDRSDARDFAMVEITTPLGEKEEVKLEETLTHSGEFTGSLQLRAVEQPTPGNLNPDDAVIETYFGDRLTVKFVDATASTETGSLEQIEEVPVVVGTDGLVAAFSKTFQDESLAVETKFRIAESFFELFKSHKGLGRSEEKKIDLESGRRVLREVMEDFPDPKYAPRISYLLGQFAQELEQWDEAIKSYDLILRQYPDHTLAPDAQYKLAQCYEQAGNFDEALEAYVTLAATHPKSPLIPNVMIRISDYFYKNENYEVAAQVGEKFIERFESNSNAPRMAFRVGQCYFKAKKYQVAGKSFDKFFEVFPKDALSADALFWSGESYRMGANTHKAFMSYLNCKDRYPESEAAKYARGRLALPEMLLQFEAEANSVDDDK